MSPSLDSTMGAVLIGGVVSSMLVFSSDVFVDALMLMAYWKVSTVSLAYRHSFTSTTTLRTRKYTASQ